MRVGALVYNQSHSIFNSNKQHIYTINPPHLLFEISHLGANLLKPLPVSALRPGILPTHCGRTIGSPSRTLPASAHGLLRREKLILKRCPL